VSWTSSARSAGYETTLIRALDANGRELTRAEVLAGLGASRELRAFLTSTLAAARPKAFFWELPPWTARTMGEPFELAIIDAPTLALTAPDPSPFASELDAAKDPDVIAFSNLGGDATLVVPRARAAHAAYAHLASFVREAPAEQIDALWRRVAKEVALHVAEDGERPLWISTAGLGVSWLHVRLDSRPKYYRFGAYKRSPV
jgi:hypothetical protein